MKVYEAVAAALVAEGCTTIFGLLGDRVMHLWNTLEMGGEVAIVSAHHEAAAVSMAEGFGRTTGSVGVAMVTSGPAVTHTATSMVSAARARSPLVLLAGDTPQHDHYNTQRLDQRGFGLACEAHVETLSNPRMAAESVRRAFHVARTQSRPVILSMPVDIQESAFPGEWNYVPSRQYLRPTPLGVDAGSVSQLADLLSAAESPILIGGRGVGLAGAKDAIVSLAERTGALLATSLRAKGLFMDCSYDIGISGGMAAAPAEALIRKADLIVGFGAELGYYTAGGGQDMFRGARVVRVDIAAIPADAGVAAADYIRGDARLVAEAVEAELARRGVQRKGFRTPETDRLLAWRPPARTAPGDGIDPRSMMEALSDMLPSKTRIVVGAGHFWNWPVTYLVTPDDVQIEYTYPFGAIGRGLPMAVGVSCASLDHPHLLIEGDGSFMQNLQELHTAAQLGLNLVILIMNDAGFGAELYKMQFEGLDPGIARNPSPDFVAITKAMGGDGVLIEHDSDVAPALRQAFDAGGLFVIDARISPSLPADRYTRDYFGGENLAPLLRPEGSR